MVVLRSAVVLFALLCLLAISDGKREKRQLGSSAYQLAALAQKLHLNISGISNICKIGFYNSNSNCLNAMAACVTSTDPTAAQKCFRLSLYCGNQCSAKDKCSTQVQAINPYSSLPPIPMCFPQVCRSDVGAFSRLLTSFTKAVFSEGNRIAAQFIAPNFVQNVVTSCGYWRATCKSVSKCFALQLRGGGGAHQQPHTARPHIPGKHGTFHAWVTHPRPTGRPQHGQHGRPNQPHFPHVNGSGHQFPWGKHHSITFHPRGKVTVRPPTRGNHNAHSRYPYCAGVKCAAGTTCCEVNGRQLGCCMDFVQALLDTIVEEPLKSTSGQCGNALIREKGACLREYVTCLNDVAKASGSLGKGGLPNLATLGGVPQSCTKLTSCFATASGNKSCTPINRCSIGYTKGAGLLASLIPLSRPNQSLCLPSECKTQQDLQLVSSLVYSFLCGPFCVLRQAWEQAGGGLSHVTDCPIDHISMTCYNPAVHRKVTVRENDASKVCTSADDLFKNEPEFPQKGSDHTSNDGWKDYFFDANKHGKSDEKKTPIWKNKWFVIGVAAGALALFAGTVVCIRWRAQVARRRHLHSFNYTGLSDETVAAVDNN